LEHPAGSEASLPGNFEGSGASNLQEGRLSAPVQRICGTCGGFARIFAAWIYGDGSMAMHAICRACTFSGCACEAPESLQGLKTY